MSERFSVKIALISIERFAFLSLINYHKLFTIPILWAFPIYVNSNFQPLPAFDHH